MNAKKVDAGSKWGEQFCGEELVPLFIPKDVLNPKKMQWLSINGQEIWLAVGEQLQVPRSVAEQWTRALEARQAAQQMMNEIVEIGGAV